MGKAHTLTFSSAGELAKAAAVSWLEALRSRRSSSGGYTVALSGGRIAEAFFATLGELPEANLLVQQRVHFFWADERCVPPDDSRSNFRLAQALLFAKTGVPQDRIHRIRGEYPPGEAARLAEEELRGITRTQAPLCPILDLVLLGMGEDGHVASLFPGESKEAAESPALFRAVNSPKPPPLRVTVGYNILWKATAVWVLASGPGKHQALAESLSAAGKTPLAKVIQGRGETLIFTEN